jgi:drug/metabolite transporter (DMT)-like permease
MNQETPQILPAPPRAWQGFLTGLLAYLAFNIGDVIIKKLSTQYSLQQIIGLVILLSLPLIYIFVRWHSGPKCMNTVAPRIQILRGFLFFTYSLTSYYGIQHLPLASFYTFVFVTPLFTVLLAVFWLKEKVTRQQVILLLLSFAGVLIAFHPEPRQINIAALVLLGGSALQAIGQVIVRRQSYGDGLGASIIYPEAIGVLLCAITGFRTFHWPDADGWMLFGGAAVLSAIANSLLVLAFYQAPASQVTPTQYSQILWGIALGYLFFGDLPDVWIIAGVSLIVVAGVRLAWLEYGATHHKNLGAVHG